MADEASTPAAEPTAGEAQTTTDPTATDGLGDAGKKALAAERSEKRAAEKRAAGLEARLKEFEDRDKTEAQKLSDRADAAERRATDLEQNAMRMEVAAEKGLTPAQARRLMGETREELLADADELRSSFTPADPTQEVIQSLDLGTRGSGTSGTPGDPATDFAKFMKRL